MKRDDNTQQKLIPTGLMFIIASGILIAALAAAFWGEVRDRRNVPSPAALSEVANGIALGNIVKIEDVQTGGEFRFFYSDGAEGKGVRDANTSLLEQLSLLGLRQDQLNKVEYTIVPGKTSTGNPLAAVLAFGLVGGAVFGITRLAQNDRMGGKKNYNQVDIPTARFDDVAGLNDTLQELRDVVTFLKNGEKFAEMGAKMPRGVLMVGDPGTGKTLIARAVAGEAGVPFFATSGSEFTEVFVGVGASRIRALFKQARKKAPCIIFIDEIDAVGRSRHRSESGAEMEQDQTLNQLLVEMDGFEGSESVVVLAATNRMDVLDSALTRPGRFDRCVHINRPDVKGREAILKIHTHGKKLAANVEMANVARATPGLVGADLANVVNEAAISAVRNDHSEIEMGDFEEAVEKMLAGGVQRKSQVMSPEERKIVAYHEAGHAVVMYETKLSDPVFKITIIPRGLAGGYTMALPETDQMLTSRQKMLARIKGLLGGRAAEEIFFQDITSGASNDLDVATHLAEEMVMRLGMDPKAGLRVYRNGQGSHFFFGPQSSQKTHEALDDAMKEILDNCYAEARSIVEEKRLTIDRIAAELLEVETIDRQRFIELMQ